MNCPACDSTLSRPLSQINGYTMRLCSACGLRFSDPMVAGTESWYRQSDLYTRKKPNRIKYWASVQALALPGKSVFDVGCGTGEFLYWAMRSGRRVGGCDFNQQNIESARESLGLTGLHVGDANQLNLGERFDLVTLFEVLEHLADPVEALRSLRRFIQPGGRLAISVPCYERWPRLFDDYADSPPHHLTLWTPAALEACLQRAGFDVIGVQRKPLQVTDIGGHLKWRLRRVLRGNVPAPQSSAPTKAPNILTKGNGLFAALLAPVCWSMRLYPRAGSFTLLGVAHPRP